MQFCVCRYSLVFFFFFNGLSFHLSAAFASHLLGFRMSWSSTTKEVVDTNFFKEVKFSACSASLPLSCTDHVQTPCKPSISAYQLPCFGSQNWSLVHWNLRMLFCRSHCAMGTSCTDDTLNLQAAVSHFPGATGAVSHTCPAHV